MNTADLNGNIMILIILIIVAIIIKLYEHFKD